MHTLLQRKKTSDIRSADTRRGTTLIIVVALLGLLALLGFTFFTFSAQEREAAEYFATEVKTAPVPADIFAWPLREIIIGPDDSNFNSALWGGRHSLVPTMLGTDGIPFNGEGINLTQTAGQPHVDRNFDGAADASDVLLNLVDSPAANSGVQFGTGKSRASLPQPDVDYTYPDINNAILSYDGFALDASGNPIRVIIPSLFRPQYMRSGGKTITDWFSNTAAFTSEQSFRPHPDHVYIDTSGSSTGVNRYVNTVADANTLGLASTFPFLPRNKDGKLGIWTGSGANEFNLDIDTDGDGVFDSPLVDLGHPPIRSTSGTLMIPLFGIQVKDLNGLINLNTSTTTLSKNPIPPAIATQEFGADASGNPRFLSSSDQGISPSEINSVYALSADPSTLSPLDLQQYRFFLKTLGADRNPLTTRELANLDWFFLVHGRPYYNPGAAAAAGVGAANMAPTIEFVVPGLLGETELLQSFLTTGSGTLPQPGRPNVDDNLDTGNSFPFIYTQSTASPALGTPLNMDGGGSVVASAANPYGKLLSFLTRSNDVTVGPNRWPIFSGYHSNSDVLLKSASTYANQLMPSTVNQLTDDPSEIIVDPLAVNSASTLGGAVVETIDSDNPYGIGDTAFLHLNAADSVTLRSSTRARSTATANFAASTTTAANKSPFTTLSTGRRELSTVTTGLGTPSATQRAWESTYLTSNTLFRVPVRTLLDNSSPLSAKLFRLSINQILVDSNGEPLPTTTPTALAFRDLTAHPSMTSTLPSQLISNPGTYTGPGFSTPAAQEFYARRDRQALARDIYTILYLYGAGADQDPLVSPSATIYTPRQLKEIAQFAVNVIDALDSDNVLTRFEYDTDLSDGWGLDDDPYSITDGGTQRKEVWGVEAQQLTISEVLAIKAPKILQGVTPYNHPATEYDDTQDRFFTYIDLQNASPYPISFSANSPWQVRFYPKGIAATTASDERRLTPLAGTIAAGGPLTIMSTGDYSTRDGSSNPTSLFRVDAGYVTGSPPNPLSVVPSTGVTSGYNRLDLILDPLTSFDLTDGTAAPTNVKAARGDFHNSTNAADVADKQPILVTLMRRADPNRLKPTSAAEELDNPWIEVDRLQAGVSGITSGLQEFPLTSTTDDNSTPTNIKALLKNLLSQYRKEPYDADSLFNIGLLWGNYSTNFIAAGKYDQSSTPPAAQYSQIHPDRPFASIGELFNIPIVGPGIGEPTATWFDATENWYLTRAVRYFSQSPIAQQTAVGADKRALVAAGKFFLADFPDGIDNDPKLDNRWYRLLEFFEVPPIGYRHPQLRSFAVSNLGLPQNFGWLKTQGTINLNTLRHPGVLAGLIDDNRVLDLQSNKLVDRDSADTAAYGVRDWFREFLASREGKESAATSFTDGFTIPGTPFSRPFRSFNFCSRGIATQSTDTLLRTLPTDTGAADPRLLFEIGQTTEHVSGTSTGGTLDNSAKYRLLSKIAGNSVTRSNVFAVYISVQFFEAAIVSGTPNSVRIGGPISESKAPIQRGFFIIDRSGALEQIRQIGSVPVSSSTFSYLPDTNGTGTPNGIRWKDLVLFRQTLN